MTVTGDHEGRITDTTHLVVNAAMNDNRLNLPLVTYQPSQHQTPKESDVVMITAENCNHVRGDTPVICHPVEEHGTRPNDTHSIRMRAGCEGGGKGALVGVNMSHTLATRNDQTIISRNLVRRLMPVECERLMGFPDDYTRIPWKGKPASECPDGPRYKACGNSWAVNCARWVCMRIEAAERFHRDGETGDD